ncbi:hypothetical protein L3V83_13815 [Thiotrichales bacterium 19X7-9]|nr:hypothetical protein [Thiotrichales bacterium 19X7-9]
MHSYCFNKKLEPLRQYEKDKKPDLKDRKKASYALQQLHNTYANKPGLSLEKN